ncbi:hypothetical protein AUP42_05105 [Thalassospira lucentensis]|uniref:Methyltransferase domain-containing protein n=1 Tax=Thalassospira lucentensis TaxID=168935 RepID=A0A154L2W4_9PROT|nr:MULTISPECIES: tetratricopeptide repeat protein [Thalassospira]KZB62324.1 hypothetical protein AUP42_05105 [Thalassospira lucentensis]MCH2275096.1 tetratricopeptide repeat protein [Thalassospira sp.]
MKKTPLSEKQHLLDGKTPESPLPHELQNALKLATTHHGAGRLQDAAAIYHQILTEVPNQPIALHLLGMVFHQTGNNSKAIELLETAVNVAPHYAQAYNNLGVVFNAEGRTGDAISCYRKAIKNNPQYAEAHKNLGAILATIENFNDALDCYRQAVMLNPNNVEAHKAIGDILINQQRPNVAIESYLKALALKPFDADLQTDTGIALQYLSRWHEALTYHSRAISMAPGANRHWTAFGDCVKNMSFSGTNESLETALLELMNRRDNRPASIMFPIISALLHRKDFSEIINKLGGGISDDTKACLEAAEILSKLPLFLSLLELVPVADLRIERMLTNIRSNLLIYAAAGNELSKLQGFLNSLALQCYANEYAYAVSPEEEYLLRQMTDFSQKATQAEKTIPPYLLSLIGCYLPLHQFDWAKPAIEKIDPEEIADVIKRQITDPEQEFILRKAIHALTGVQDATSRAVQAQYEENPYPRWIRAGVFTDSRTIKDVLTSAPLNFNLGNYSSPEIPEILIAGCGTGQHALQTATRFKNAKVIAVDLSRSSLSYAWRKTQEMGIENIQYLQGDILKLDLLDRQFDIIECGGVLHHMADPLEGWTVLNRLLKPGGLMKIGLYSEIGRPDVIAARSFIQKHGYTTSADDMRRCRQEIISAAETGDQALIQLCMRADFYSLSPCRDLIFHIQEHRFTIPQIEDALKKLNLKFIDFETQSPQTLTRFRNENAGCPESLILKRWNDYEARFPETFRGMYQFWCQKPDSNNQR